MSYIKKYRKLQITSVSGEKIVAGEVLGAAWWISTREELMEPHMETLTL